MGDAVKRSRQKRASEVLGPLLAPSGRRSEGDDVATARRARDLAARLVLAADELESADTAPAYRARVRALLLRVDEAAERRRVDDFAALAYIVQLADAARTSSASLARADVLARRIYVAFGERFPLAAASIAWEQLADVIRAPATGRPKKGATAPTRAAAIVALARPILDEYDLEERTLEREITRELSRRRTRARKNR